MDDDDDDNEGKPPHDSNITESKILYHLYACTCMHNILMYV